MNLKRFIPVTIIVVSTFVAGVLFATLGANLFSQGDRVGSDLQAGTPSIVRGAELAPQYSLEEAFINVTATINPTVVQINSLQEVEVPRAMRQFFDGGPRQGLGSGVIVRSDGYIVTNNHVIAGASKLHVMLHDGSVERAEVVGADSSSDLALIKIDLDDLPSIPLGDSEDIRVGQWVLAFGSPLSQALDNSVTAGIVSALNRTSAQLTSLNLHSSFIQTDAAINRGNSGGPLVNLKGQLIGINTAILSPTGLNSGVGFAIPVDVVDNVITQLIEKGRVDRGFLGIRFQNVSLALVQALSVPPGAAQITAVIPDGPAYEAGLETGMIITRINGILLNESNQLRVMIANMKPGDEVELDVSDGTESKQYTVRLGLLDLESILGVASTEDDSDARTDNLQELGLTLRTFNADDFARQAELDFAPGFQGVIVEDVDRYGSAYTDSEIRRGDIIVEVDRRSISNLREFQRIYNGLDRGGVVIVKVKRLVGIQEDTREFIDVLTALTKPE
ncbi:MAG: trypsin-like peptidase domain-containing protein [Bacteroidota bacterium]|nr:trypsin-like peptidase domain-containing protein [Bacteroidota bacterium]